MKKWFFLLISLPVIIISCSKGDESACGFSDSGASASAVEISYIQNYLSANSLTATQHSSGLFYTIDDPGTTNTAAICSNVTVNYTGSLMANGVVFDSNPQSELQEVINKLGALKQAIIEADKMFSNEVK